MMGRWTAVASVATALAATGAWAENHAPPIELEEGDTIAYACPLGDVEFVVVPVPSVDGKDEDALAIVEIVVGETASPVVPFVLERAGPGVYAGAEGVFVRSAPIFVDGRSGTTAACDETSYDRIRRPFLYGEP